MHQLAGHTGEVHCVGFIAGGTQLISGSADKSIRLWDASTSGGASHVLEAAHAKEVSSLAARGASCIASGSADKTVKLWAVSNSSGSLTELSTLRGHTDAVTGTPAAPPPQTRGSVPSPPF